MISTGVILNIINSFHRKIMNPAFLDIMALLADCFIGLLSDLGWCAYAVYGNLGMDTKVLLLVLAVPGNHLFKEPLAHVLFHHEHTGEKLFRPVLACFLWKRRLM